MTFDLKVTVPAPPSAPFAWQMVQDGVEWFGSPTPVAIVHIAEPARCAPIRTEITSNTNAIRLLQGSLAGLNPRDAGDRAEIREIGQQIFAAASAAAG